VSTRFCVVCGRPAATLAPSQAIETTEDRPGPILDTHVEPVINPTGAFDAADRLGERGEARNPEIDYADFAPGFVGAARINSTLKNLTRTVWIWAALYGCAELLTLRALLRVYQEDPSAAMRFLPSFIGGLFGLIVPLIWYLIAVRALANRSHRALLMLRILLWAIIPWQTFSVLLFVFYIAIRRESLEPPDYFNLSASMALFGVAVYGLLKLRGAKMSAFCSFRSSK